jgi:hypothetical protein
VHIAERATGGKVAIRDVGLLQAAVARPQATAFGAAARFLRRQRMAAEAN